MMRGRAVPGVDLPAEQSRFPPATQTVPLPRNRFTLWLLRIPLVFIYGLLGFACYAYLWSLVIGYLLVEKHEWLRGTVLGGLFIVLCGGSASSCAMCVYRSAGSPLDKARLEDGKPDGSHEALLSSTEDGDAEDRLMGVMRKNDGRKRFCRKCQCYKPDRTHHCSACRQCVLKMDHHCPWLGGGCVGWANYKFFLLFLGYTALLGTFVAISTFWELYRYVGSSDMFVAPVMWAIIALIGAVFGFVLIAFGLYHLWLACNNRTTIESMERTPLVTAGVAYDSEIPRDVRRKYERKMSRINVYDLGWRANLADIFGGWEHKWTWFVPVGYPPYGDGRSFPVDRKKMRALQQLRDDLARYRHRPHDEHHDHESEEADVDSST